MQVSDRSVLGPADVSDADLTEIVARWLGESSDDVEVVCSSAEVVPYELDAITTAGRYWVTARATTPSGERRVRMFVKHVQSWARSPFFQFVPEEQLVGEVGGVCWRGRVVLQLQDREERIPMARRHRGLAREGRARCHEQEPQYETSPNIAHRALNVAR